MFRFIQPLTSSHLVLAIPAHDRAAGFACITLSAMAYGAMANFGKLAYEQGIALDSLLFLRFTIAGSVMSGWMLITRQTWPRGWSLIGLVLMGGVGYVRQSWCYCMALSYAFAGLTALLLYLFPAIVTLLQAVLSSSSSPKKPSFPNEAPGISGSRF